MTNATAVAPERATTPQTRAQTVPAPAPTEQQVSAGLSQSLIVLSLRPEGSKFNGDRVERAQEAGFDWLKKVHLIGMSNPDTGGEIARHVVHGGHEACGALKEIQIQIDPENCAMAWKAGRLLMGRLKKYAVLIGAHVCDGLGQPLTDEAMLAISNHVDEVMDRRLREERLARTVTLPNGEQREMSELSFDYTVIREAGSKKKAYRRVRFVAPKLHYHEGRAIGMRMAGEVVNFFRKHQTQELDIQGILKDVYAIGQSDYCKATQGNVAAGFLEVLSTLIRVGAQHLNPLWLDEQIRLHGALHNEWMLAREERKTEFVSRMKAAREAKQLKRGI